MKSAKRLSGYLTKELSLEARKGDVLRFGAEIVFSTALGTAAVAATAYILGCLGETLAVLIAYAVIRTFAGGAHCSTPWRCAISTVMVFPVLGRAAVELPAYLPGFQGYGLAGLSACALLLVAALAPVDNPVNPIKDHKRRRALKRNSVAAVVVVTALLSVVPHLIPAATPAVMWGGAFGLAWSAAVLTRPVHRLMEALDTTLGRVLAFGRDRRS